MKCLVVVIIAATTLAIASASSDSELDHLPPLLHPVEHAEPESNGPKDHKKRFLFKKNFSFTVGTARHVGIHPTGHKFVIGYGPVSLKYVPTLKASVTYLQPHHVDSHHVHHWKPKPILKPVHRPVVLVTAPPALPLPHPPPVPHPAPVHEIPQFLPGIQQPVHPALPVSETPIPKPIGLLSSVPFYKPLPPLNFVPAPIPQLAPIPQAPLINPIFSLLKPELSHFIPTAASPLVGIPPIPPVAQVLATAPPALAPAPVPVAVPVPAPAPLPFVDHGETDVQLPIHLPEHPNFRPLGGDFPAIPAEHHEGLQKYSFLYLPTHRSSDSQSEEPQDDDEYEDS